MFRSRLDEETDHIKHLFENDLFSTRGDILGFELEVCLVNPDGTPSPTNRELLDHLDSPLVVPELASFNIEFNGSPAALQGKVFSHIHDELQTTWTQCQDAAEDLNKKIIAIGILPTIKPSMLNSDYMSDMVRYRALNDRFMALRDGEPLKIDIECEDRLQMVHSDVMLEAATTSFQIHLQGQPETAVRDYNACIVASAPMVALAANSPFLFGKSLWAETRIPIFEQALALGERYPPRVKFGDGYIQESIFELYDENRSRQVILLPYVQPEPMMKYAHMRFHNGTIWRWNRPLIGFDFDGQPHLRFEYRSVPSGPTLEDTAANAATNIGFVKYLTNLSDPIEDRIPFDIAKENFYAAARQGLAAEITWKDHKVWPIKELILQELLPAAHRALSEHGVDSVDLDHYLGIVEARVANGQNGSTWQRHWVDRHGPIFEDLVLAYWERQESGIPVHKWNLN